jgi:hypothetical protein
MFYVKDCQLTISCYKSTTNITSVNPKYTKFHIINICLTYILFHFVSTFHFSAVTLTFYNYISRTSYSLSTQDFGLV